MIPVEITEDLRAGLTLEDTLIKHGTNLRELFKPNKKRTPCHFNEFTSIRFTPHNTYRIVKKIGLHDVQFGTYKTHEDALIVRNELIKCNWDKSQLEKIYRETGVKPSKKKR